jgi:hypothetical protein
MADTTATEEVSGDFQDKTLKCKVRNLLYGQQTLIDVNL